MNQLSATQYVWKGTVVCLAILMLSGCTTNSTSTQPVEIGTLPESTEIVDIPVQVVTSTFYLPIAALHHVGPVPAGLSAAAATWYISTSTLDTLIVEALERDYTLLTISDALTRIEENRLPLRPLVLTFDDGWSDVYTYAFPILQKYHTPASVFLMTGVVRGVLTDEEVLEMQASGLFDVQSHTRYHQYLTRVSAAEQRAELSSSYDAIRELTGTPPVAIAYPFGLYDEGVKDLAADIGYEVGLTIKDGVVQEDLLELRRTIITEQTNIEGLFDRWESAR